MYCSGCASRCMDCDGTSTSSVSTADCCTSSPNGSIISSSSFSGIAGKRSSQPLALRPWKEDPALVFPTFPVELSPFRSLSDDTLKGLYIGLKSILGSSISLLPRLKTGMSGLPSVSKSSALSWKCPTAFLTVDISICHIACSLSNFISVFTGCILTSMSSGFTVK